MKYTAKFPAMKVNRVGMFHWKTANENGTGQLVKDDGTGIFFKVLNIPPTNVAVHPFDFPNIAMVDECLATAVEPEGKTVIELDREPVALRMTGIVALAMPAKITVTLADGEVWIGHGVFPDCPIVGGVAQPVVVEFMLTKGGSL